MKFCFNLICCQQRTQTFIIYLMYDFMQRLISSPCHFNVYLYVNFNDTQIKYATKMTSPQDFQFDHALM